MQRERFSAVERVRRPGRHGLRPGQHAVRRILLGWHQDNPHERRGLSTRSLRPSGCAGAMVCAEVYYDREWAIARAKLEGRLDALEHRLKPLHGQRPRQETLE